MIPRCQFPYSCRAKGMGYCQPCYMSALMKEKWRYDAAFRERNIAATIASNRARAFIPAHLKPYAYKLWRYGISADERRRAIKEAA